MSTTATALIGAKVVFDDNTEVVIYEGDIISGLTFKEGNVIKHVNGSVRVINVNTRSYSAGPDECPPESFIRDIASITEIVIDTSSQYDADIIRVNPENILSIATVNDTPPRPAIIDPNVKVIYVYNQETWDAAKKLGVPENWMPVYDPNVEQHPWIVAIFYRGNAEKPTSLSSFVVTNKNGVVNTVNTMFASGKFEMTKDVHMLGLEMITPEVPDGKDYLVQSKLTSGDSYTVYAVVNGTITVSNMAKYMGPSL